MNIATNEQQNNSAGSHLIIDGYTSDITSFTEKAIMLLFDELAKTLEMTILKKEIIEVQLQPEKLDSDQFQDDGGISAFAIISTSHIAIHCWPLRNFFSMDIFSCKYFNSNKAIKLINKQLKTTSINILDFNRQKPTN